MQLLLDVFLHPVSFRAAEPVVAITEDIGRGGCRCRCGQPLSIKYKTDAELQSFMGAIRDAGTRLMRESGIQRPVSGHISIELIIYRARPIEHYQNGLKELGKKPGREDALPMSSQHSYKVYESVIKSLSGTLYNDIRQIRAQHIKDVYGDEERIKALIRTVKTVDVDDRFKQLDLFDLEC